MAASAVTRTVPAFTSRI